MPKKTGLDLAAEVRARGDDLPIIFLTSSPEFAVQSYRVQIQDYLLKPVTQTDFFASLHRQMQRISQHERHLLLQTASGLFHMPVSHIVYMEALNHKLRFVQTNGSSIDTADTISSIAESLVPYKYFVRPHRSYLVNLRQVKSLEKNGLYTKTGTFIPIARGNFNKIKSQSMDTLLEL